MQVSFLAAVLPALIIIYRIDSAFSEKKVPLAVQSSLQLFLYL